MQTEIKYGIVIDNQDIHETGKIRVILLEEIPSNFRNKNVAELKTLLSNLDNGGSYAPWQKATYTKSADPYLTEPFLPKHINIIPEEGQLVKIILFESLYREYVGPAISSLENQKEAYVNSLSAFRTQQKKALIQKGYVNKVSDVGFYGTNSQLILGDKELVLRTNAQDEVKKKKNTELTLIQQSTFNNTLHIDKSVKNVVREPEKIVSHLLEIKYEKKFREFLNEKTIVGKFKLFSLLNHRNADGKLGVTSLTYQPNNPYTDASLELEFDFITDDATAVDNYITELRQGLIERKFNPLSSLVSVGGKLQTTINSDKFDVTITDHRIMTSTYAEIQDRKEIEVISLITRIANDQTIFSDTAEFLEQLGVSPKYLVTNPAFYQKERTNLVTLNSLTRRISSVVKVDSKILNNGPRVVQETVLTTKTEAKNDSFTVLASKKHLILSTEVTPNLISDNPNQYGLSQKDLTELIDPATLKTYSIVRGEPLIQTLTRLIDVLLAHGHSTGNTVKNSLESDTRTELMKIKEDLTKQVRNDLSGGPTLLNQYIRVN